MKQVKPFGTWPSAVNAEILTKGIVGLSETTCKEGKFYWVESRPQERSRNVIVESVAKSDGSYVERDVLPNPLNARSRVNEYGGGVYCVDNRFAYFVQFDDQQVYRIPLPSALTENEVAEGKLAQPEQLTNADNCRFAALQDVPHSNYLIAVCEDHSRDGEPETSLVAISKSPKSNPHISESNRESVKIITSGYDFYSAPTVSPTGKEIAWICWNHPYMPWDHTECWSAELNADASLSNILCVSANENESIAQPKFSPDGTLYYVSDRNNWWNIYRHDKNKSPVVKLDAEFAEPQWVFAQSNYAFLNEQTIICTSTCNGDWQLSTINTESQKVTSQIADSSYFAYISAHNNNALLISATAEEFPAVYKFQNRNNKLEKFKSVNPVNIPLASIATSESLIFHNRRGDSVQAFFYKPVSDRYTANNDELPPVIAMCHGGPTAATSGALNLKIQFWTSRGFAVVDINYSGSTGFGRNYRERLNNSWGLIDVEDVVDCIQYLGKQQLIDPDRALIRGGSAGGYSVLCALTFHDVFAGGASLYGIGDLELLASDTHKFESRYMDSLIGEYPAQQNIYRERSPINAIDRLHKPVIFLQGLLDKVVPPNQAETMVQALKNKNIPVAYVTFDNEAHGFRQANNVKRAFEAEYYFYCKILGLECNEDIAEVTIYNMN